MTTLPDWLVERAALDEVGPAGRDRIDRADPDELAARVTALRAANAAELAKHPADPAVADIERRVARERARRATARRTLSIVGLAAASAAAVLVFVRARHDDAVIVDPPIVRDGSDDIRVKGPARLMAFRRAGDHVEQLDADAVVHAGDLIQLRYNAGGRRYGMIASVDGAGAVTLHYPVREDAPAEATAIPAETHSLPNAYELDDAPRFERFFFVTASEPIDVQRRLADLRAFARRTDSDTAAPELPAGVHQASLRLRKADRSPNPKSP